MSEVANYLGTLAADPMALLVSAVAFVTVFIAAFAVGRRLMTPRVPYRSAPPAAARSSPGRPSLLGRTGPAQNRSSTATPPTSSARGTDSPDIRSPTGTRQTLLTLHRVLTVLVVGVLLALTVSSYFSSSPDDGSMLVPAILAVVTLIVWLKLHNWRERYDPAEPDPAVRSDLARTIHADLSDKIAAALLDPARVKWEVASPEVYSMDGATLDRARAMASEGRPMDEICRSVQADYDRWDGAHQQAFQAVMREAIAHGA